MCIRDSIRTKAGVRTLAQIDDDQIACGENDGFVDILSISSLSVNIGKRFEQIGHIYQVQATSLRNEIVVCSYTGVHFVKVFQDQMTGMMSLHLSPIAYITEQFVNKVIEYDHGRFLAAVWDSSKYILIDHEQEKMGKNIAHPMAATS